MKKAVITEKFSPGTEGKITKAAKERLEKIIENKKTMNNPKASGAAKTQAKKQNKTTVGLEFMEEQLNAFKSIPYDVQAKELFKAVEDAYKGEGQEIDELIEYYLNEDLDKLLELTLNSQFMDEEINIIFKQVFLIDRNHKMAERSIKYMESGPTFIAVGAAHLPGKEGVIENLRRKGYTVEAF